jgi:hypothetical protein
MHRLTPETVAFRRIEIQDRGREARPSGGTGRARPLPPPNSCEENRRLNLSGIRGFASDLGRCESLGVRQERETLALKTRACYGSSNSIVGERPGLVPRGARTDSGATGAGAWAARGLHPARRESHGCGQRSAAARGFTSAGRRGPPIHGETCSVRPKPDLKIVPSIDSSHRPGVGSILDLPLSARRVVRPPQPSFLSISIALAQRRSSCAWA